MITFIVVYTIMGVVIFWIIYIIYHLYTFQEGDFIYELAQWAQLRASLWVPLYFIIGYSVIFWHYWKKPFIYVENIINATKSIYNLDDTLVELPVDLKEAEIQMNQIKLNVKNNQQIAQKAEQRKNDLVVYLAHDLKTPLTSVIGYLTLLRDESQISNELREKYLSISLEKAERLEDLINEFFEITRFNLFNITLEPSRINLTRMLEQLIFEFKPMFLDKNLQCMLNAAPDIMLKCDVDKMQRVFDNLLRNAVNYSFDDSTIEITVTQFENEIKLNFLNHGNTIPREKLERLFEKFYRLDTARITKSGGAGLGLAIAKEIVELHQGTILAKSEDERISFQVTIPIL